MVDEHRLDEIRAARKRQVTRVEQAKLALTREQAILDGLNRALGNSAATGFNEPLLLKTRDVLSVFSRVAGRIRKRELRERLAQAGHDVKRSDFLPRFNTILRRQREMETLTRTIEGEAIYFERGPNFPADLKI